MENLGVDNYHHERKYTCGNCFSRVIPFSYQTQINSGYGYWAMTDVRNIKS